jgi:hypothetical protein
MKVWFNEILFMGCSSSMTALLAEGSPKFQRHRIKEDVLRTPILTSLVDQTFCEPLMNDLSEEPIAILD